MKLQPENRYVNDDEIDLFELIANIWKQKIIVISITFLVTLLALAYAFIVTPTYSTSVLLKPVTNKELDELNRTKLISVSPDQALFTVGRELNSYELLFSFYKDNLELFESYINEDLTEEENFANFFTNDTKVITSEPSRDDVSPINEFVKFEINYSGDVNGSAIANGIVDYVIDAYKNEILQSIDIAKTNSLTNLNRELISFRAGYKANLDSEIANIQEQDNIKRLELQEELRSIRKSLTNIRSNRIQLLDESIKIAKKLGITKPTTPSDFGSSGINFSGNIFKTEINSNQIPLYFMGVDALEAEKTALESRVSDDFISTRIVEIQRELQLLDRNPKIELLQARKNPDLFLENFAEKEKQISFLENTKIDIDGLKLVQIDHYAFHIKSSQSPSKKLIVIIGLVLGLFLGLFAALIRQAVINYRNS